MKNPAFDGMETDEVADPAPGTGGPAAAKANGRLHNAVCLPRVSQQELAAMLKYVRANMDAFWDGLGEYIKVSLQRAAYPQSAEELEEYHEFRLYAIMFLLGLVRELRDIMLSSYRNGVLAHHAECAKSFLNRVALWTKQDCGAAPESNSLTVKDQADTDNIVARRVADFKSMILHGQSPVSV